MRKKAGLSEIAVLRRIAAKTYTRITDGNRKAGADGMSAPVFPCFAYGRKNDGKRRSNSDEKIMKVWNIQIHPIRRTGGKTLAVDCTQTANTEFYIDLGKEYDIYTGAGFSDKTPENFYQKSAAEFRIKLNDTHRGLRQYDSVIPDYSRLKIPRRGTEKNYTKKPGSFYASG